MATVFDRVSKILGFGPDRWDERLAPTIEFISPDGKPFSGKWIKSERGMDKNVGIFSYPKVKGNTTQDLGINSEKWTIPFAFDGKNNDIKTQSFFRACKETGLWGVTHPVHGYVDLQLLSVKYADAPVESGNVTFFSTSWIEPIDPETLLTGREAAGIVDASITEVNVSVAQGYADKIKTGSETLNKNIEDAVNLVDNLTEYALGPLFSTNDSLNASFRAIQTGIQDTLLATDYKAQALAGQIQNLIQQSVLSTTNVDKRTSAYVNVKTGALSEVASKSGQGTDETINVVSVNEIALTSVICSFAKIAITSNFTSKVQVSSFMDDIISQYNDIVNGLDNVQADFSEKNINAQYFSLSTTFSLLSQLVAQVIKYLNIASFDLKVEKRFILSEPKVPVDIVIEQYGELGENGQLFDEFIALNRLKGWDITLLPMGREVVVYV